MKDLLAVSKLYVKKNSATILTCVGAVGVVVTSVLAVKATPKAMELLKEAEQEKGEKLTKKETVIVAGPSYIPAAVAGASTIACIFGANVLNKRKQAAITSAYAMLDNTYKEYKKKVVELYGADTDEEIRTEIAKDKYDSGITVSEDTLIFYDEFSGQYFESTLREVQ